MKRICFQAFAACLFVIVPALHAQITGSITGRITAADGTPVQAIDVRLVDLRRQTTTDANGVYRFDNVPAGRHVVQVESARFGRAAREADVASGTTTIDIALDLTVHAEEIVVSASPDTRSVAEVYQPVDVLKAEELAARMQPTLGDTLAQQPGVNSTGYVPGASRPVIRGFGGDRIRILEDGIGVGDASAVSQDHNVSVDPATAESIEIVRGPATLLYGSNAVGGVVNVIDDHVPNTLPGAAISGTLDLRGSTAFGEKNAQLTLEGERGRIAWHAEGGLRDTGNTETPIGTLFNSDVESNNASVGASWISGHSFLGLAYSGYDTNYGVSDAGPGNELPAEESVRIDMRQRRLDLKGEMARDRGPFSLFRARFGQTDYEHAEVVGGEPEMEFFNDFMEGRLEALHRELGPVTGAFGIQFSERDFTTQGDEVLIAPTTTSTRALFLFEEAKHGMWRFQIGARYESEEIDVVSDELPDRTFDGLSGSLGVVMLPSPRWSAALSLSRANRLPTAEELYFNGPHEATFTFEIGNPNLRSEVANGIDVALRKREGRVTGELSLFVTRFDGYIFQNPTGAFEDDLRVFEYAQGDARFRGAEAHADIELLHRDPDHIVLELSGDFVRAELTGGGNLPFIPPARFGVGVRYQGQSLSGYLEARRTFSQTRTAALETPTDGYTLVNASISYRFFLQDTVHDVMLRGNNLTNELARSHLNPLKEIVPLAGRDFAVSYRVTF